MSTKTHKTISLKNKLDTSSIYQFALNCTDDCVWLWNLESNLLTVYGQPDKILILNPQPPSLTMESWALRIHPDDQAIIKQKTVLLIKGEMTQLTQDYRFKNPDEQWVWLNSQAKVFDHHPNGQAKNIIGFIHFIDKQKNLENKLKQSNQLFNNAFEGTYDTLWNWDVQMDAIEVSDNWKSIIGLPLKTTLSVQHHWAPIIHPDDLNTTQKTVFNFLKSKEKHLNIEYRIKIKNNQYRWVMLRGHILEQQADGKAKRIIGILTDIEPLKQHEQSLKERDEQLALAMYSTHSSLFDYDIKNQSFKQIGFERTDHKIKAIKREGTLEQGISTVHPDDQADNVGFFNSFSDLNTFPKEAKWRSNYRNNEYRWQHVKGQVVESNTQGQPTRAVGIRQDIHETYSIELEAIRNRKRTQLALQNTCHTVWEWNPLSNYFYIGDNLIKNLVDDKRQWQYTLSFWLSFVHPEDFDKTRGLIEPQLKEKDSHLNISYRIKTKNNDWVWVAIKGQTIEWSDDKQPTRVIGNIIDISDQKKIEQALITEKRLAETTLESISDAVITTDQYSAITSLNHKAKELFRISSQQAHGKVLNDVCKLTEEDNDTDAQNPSQLCIQADLAFNLSKLKLINKAGDIFYIDCSASPIHDDNDEIIGSVMVIRDVTQSRIMSHEIEHRAQHDSLTNLYNRHTFETELNQSTQLDDFEHILCYIDLDQFKIVNDTCGHTAGDELLRQLAKKISVNIRKADVFARLGGDEFGILMKNCNIDQAYKIAEQIKQTVSEYTFHWHDKTFKLGASIGLASIDPTTSPTLAMQHADTACFAAKEQGRNRIHDYKLDDNEMALTHSQMDWVPRLQKALQQDYFELYAQGIVNLQKTSAPVSHFEVLLRLNENGNIIPPGAFLPAAERYNLSSQLDKWVIQKTLETLKEQRQNITHNDVFNVNLSAASLNEDGFLDFIKDTFENTQVPPKSICFEITETAAVTNLSAANTFIDELKKMGCQFALDDFGSGLSSFGYLKSFAVDYLKIDGAFVKDLIEDPIDAAMVKSINEIGQIMGKKTVAEMVENQEIADFLQKTGVDYAQGYHFSKPKPLVEILSQK